MSEHELLLSQVIESLKDVRKDIRDLRVDVNKNVATLQDDIKANVDSLTKVRVNLGKLSLLATLGGFFGGAVLDTAKDTFPFIHKQEKIKIEQTKPNKGE